MAVGGVGQDVQRHVAAAGVEGDVGVGDGWDVVIAEADEDVALEFGGEAGAVAGQQRLDVGLAGPRAAVASSAAITAAGTSGRMQPGMVGLARRGPRRRRPRCPRRTLCACSIAVSRSRVVVVDGLARSGPDGRDRKLLLPVREAEQRDRVVAAMPRLGDDREAGAERMADADDRHGGSGRAAELRRALRQQRRTWATNAAAAALIVSKLTWSPSAGLLLAPTPRWSAATTTKPWAVMCSAKL